MRGITFAESAISYNSMMEYQDSHKGQIDFEEFYSPCFRGDEERNQFFKDADSNPKAKRIYKRAARMIWLADRIDEFVHGRPALQVFFLLIAAELVGKIYEDFEKQGRSREYVHLFFENLCEPCDRELLARSFETVDLKSLCLSEAVEVFYEVRCAVAHEGAYYDFLLPPRSFSDRLGLTIGAPRELVAHLSVSDLRLIVLRGTIATGRRLLATEEHG